MAEINDRLIVELAVNIDQLGSRLDKAVAKFAASNNAMAKSAQESAKRIEAAFGAIDIDKALNGSFGRIKTGILEEGASKLGAFGGALENLGVVGLVAAGGLMAAAEGIEHAKKALEFDEQLENTAAILGVTTSKLQEYLYAFQSVGVAPDSAIESLRKLNESLGAFKSGVGGARLNKVFDFLELSADDRKNIKTVDDFLPLLANKIAALGNAAEQARVLSRLGLGDLQPVLTKGAAGLAQLTTEAERTGAVMSEASVKGGAAMNSELNKMDAQIRGRMLGAFSAMGGSAVVLKKLVLDLAGAFQWLAEKMNGGTAADAFNNADKAYKAAKARLADNTAGKLDWTQSSGAQLFDQANHGKADPAVLAMQRVGLQKDVHNTADAVLATYKAAYGKTDEKPDGGDGRPPIVKAPKTPKGGSADDSETLAENAAKAAAEGAKAYLSAQAALTQNVVQHGQEEKAAIDADLAAKGIELQKQIDKVNDDKNLSAARKLTLVAEINLGRLGEQQAAVAKKALVDRQTAEKVLESRRANEAEINGYAITLLNDAKDLATTSTERRALALSALAIEQQQAKSDLADKQRKGFADGSLSRDQAEAQANGLAATQQMQTAQTMRGTAGPGEAYANSQNGLGLGDQLQGVEVDGIEKLGDAIDSIALKTKTAREAFHEMALSIVQDLVKIAVQKTITQPIANAVFGGGTAPAGNTAAVASSVALAGLTASATSAAVALAAISAGGAGGGSGGFPGLPALNLINLLPHHADGTDDAPGGPSMVGEDGPEVRNLNPGDTITPLGKVQSMTPASMARQTQHTHITTQIDLTGANGDETIRRIAHAAASAGTAHAVAISRAAIPDDLNRRQNGNLRRR
jgi:hypothetical protein